MDERLTRERRLRKRDEIIFVLKKGRKIENEDFKIFYTEKTIESKVGISVRRKIVNSVKRNRIRRILKEIFRKKREKFKKNIKMMIIVKKDISGKKYDEIKNEFIKMIGKRGLI